jgi:tetratricopeptide (TPR) repeat protein
LKLGLIALCLVGGTLLAIFQGFWYAFPILLIGILLLASYLLLGTIQSAAKFIQAMDFEGASKRLDLILFPKLLYVTNKAYYYILKGTIAEHQGRSEEAEALLNEAQNLDLPTDNEKAAVALQLANISAKKNKWNQAKLQFRNIKNLKVTEGALKEQIKEFEKALNNRGQIKAATRAGYGGKTKGIPLKPGGKRRRPKMR